MQRTGPTRTVRRAAATVGLSAVAVALAAAFTGMPAQAATGEIRNAGASNAVSGSYIVVLKDTSTLRSQGVAASTENVSQRYGAKVKHRYSTALKGFSATMSEAQAKRLAADPAVSYVQQDRVVRMLETQNNPPWGLDRIDQRALPLSNSYTYNTTASNVTAYIIDTGINTTHNDFGGRATHGRDTVDNDNDATDCNGHGTHVAGTVGGSTYGVAKGVKLVAVRVLNCQGSGTTAGVAAGIDWVTANAVKPAVANMSLGGGADATLDAAVQRSIAAGVTYAIASGNSNANACNYSPARVPEAITVNASDNSDARASFSNYGNCTDIFAPGVNILSAWIGSNTATNTISGTSMATPHTAGAAALYLAGAPNATPAQVATALTGGATPDVISNPGSGSPNKLLFTVEGDGGGDPEPPTGCDPITNGTDVAIPDPGTATSTITVTGCDGNAPSNLKVSVNIQHTYRGDLVIDLLAPDGTAYRLKNSSAFDSADNVVATYTVNASSETANGAWKLRVQDVYSWDSGTINSWTLF